MRLYGLTKYAETLNYNTNKIGFKVNGRKQQDRKTATKAVKFHINQEIKFQYKRKQHLNPQLYQSHLECAHHYNGMWQHKQTIID